MNSGFFYKTAAEREKLVDAERKFIDDRVRKVIKLKKEVRTKWALAIPQILFGLFTILFSMSQVCGDSDKTFVVINQKVRPPLHICMTVT